jgi:hypothetical protein
MKVSVGYAEKAVLELLRAEGPVLSSSFIRSRLVPEGVEPVTLGLALSAGTILDRVAPSMYSVLGAHFLPSDIEHARALAGRLGKVVKALGYEWTADGAVLRWDILDPARWAGTLGVPTNLVLDGDWTLIDGRGKKRGSVTVRGSAMWGALLGLVKRGAGMNPVRIELLFRSSSREAVVSLLAGHPDSGTLRMDAITSMEVAMLLGPLPVSLGCNARGDVWIADSNGRIPAEERRSVTGRVDLIDNAIVPAVLRAKPDGARFVLYEDGVELASTGLRILRIQAI